MHARHSSYQSPRQKISLTEASNFSDGHNLAAKMLNSRHMVCMGKGPRQNHFDCGRHRCRHLRIGFTLALAFFAGSQLGFAQSLSSSNVFVGYSFVGANLYTGQHANLNGWNLTGEKKFLPFFGVLADFSGHYGSTDIPSSGPCAAGSPAGCPVNSSISEYYFQGGIRGSYATKWVRPYADLLLGAVRITESGSGAEVSKNGFEATLGAGLDVRIAKRFAWRIDGGYVRTGSFVAQQNSLRASTGPVFLF